jgi:hypothetical protein
VTLKRSAFCSKSIFVSFISHNQHPFFLKHLPPELCNVHRLSLCGMNRSFVCERERETVGVRIMSVGVWGGGGGANMHACMG